MIGLRPKRAESENDVRLNDGWYLRVTLREKQRGGWRTIHGPFATRVQARRFRARVIRAERTIEPRLTVDPMIGRIEVYSDADNGCPATCGEGRYEIVDRAELERMQGRTF